MGKKYILFLEKKNIVKHKFFQAGKLDVLQFPGTFEEKQFCFSRAEANAFVKCVNKHNFPSQCTEEPRRKEHPRTETFSNAASLMYLNRAC